jgi:hypothetical protein
MATTRDKVKIAIDRTAAKSRNAVDKGAEMGKKVAKKTGQAMKNAGQKIKNSGK